MRVTDKVYTNFVRISAGIITIVIFVLGVGAALALTLDGHVSSAVRLIMEKEENQISNRKTGDRLPAWWTSCTSDNECAILPHPCCPGWTSGAFSLSVIKNKSIDNSVCQPKPAECISAQPAIPSGKVIRSVCRKNRCVIQYIDKNLFEPVRMGVPCKESKQCPGPAGVCGKDGFCIEGNK